MPHTSLPIGIDDFKEMIEKNFYYVDKTDLIRELLDKNGKVSLFTRPRRFGKTLNLSMLKYFFEKPLPEEVSNRGLFTGLKITEAGERYEKEQEQYPVIMLTLKSARQPSWEMAYESIVDEIAKEYARHTYMMESDTLLEEEKKKFLAIRKQEAEEIDYAKSLEFLSRCLEKYYNRKVIILIDEYDVPLENAYYAGFYEKMINFIRSLFESALKSNTSLEFSVITGCLRISKESIFTGLNNLEIISILNEDYGEYFGFTETEVLEMLSFYQLQQKQEILQKWYNGYQFGNTRVYNPWSVINYVKQLCSNRNAFPTAAWSNSSSNSIIRDLIYRADDTVRDEIEQLVNGGTIIKKVHEDITYEDIYDSEDNLWNFLFFTGYLKVTELNFDVDERYAVLAIPNLEVRSIYKNTIMNWFREKIKEENFSILYGAVLEGKANLFQRELQRELQKTISYMDNAEAFYHGFLLGIFTNLKDYIVKSNREAGNGRYDICIRKHDLSKVPLILELKVAKKYKQLEQSATEAIAQICDRNYDAELAEEGYEEVIHYGVAFFRKQVHIVMERKRIGEP